MPIPHQYQERVYAGVLGKIIGVYLGRPFEGWTHDRIVAELGEIDYYVNDRLGVPLVVADDDISGTFTFLRALPDHGNTPDLTPAQIGQTWLNYIVEGRTILWWGGMGNSTEHTAYLRLKRGVPAPRSGSAALNTTVVAEQIGAQIFVDGWAMVVPGDPERAADLARRAASVSHDGEAIYGAQALAAMEALAFVERDTTALLDAALEVIPRDSIIARLHHDVRAWHAGHGDWRRTRASIEREYGYDRYGGNCHTVPNHALILLGLLYGDGDFQRSLLITNTAGWDTDCNSGNLGCLLGIRDGLATLDAGPDWRGPVADRIYLSTADGGRAITDAAQESLRIVNIGRAFAGEEPLAPKGGARFHFELPGSVQGFQADAESARTLSVENVAGRSETGSRSLRLRYRGLATGRVARAATATFIPPADLAGFGYTLLASPTLYPGQTVRAALAAAHDNRTPVRARLYIECYGVDDRASRAYGPETLLAPGAQQSMCWPLTGEIDFPIAAVGVELTSGARADGEVFLDYLTWDGTPELVFTRPRHKGAMWSRAWIDGTSQRELHWPEAFRLVQNEGRGLLITGTREWTDYAVSAALIPHMAEACGLAARVQGLRRYYALLLHHDGTARLIKALDGDSVLAETECRWEPGRSYDLRLQVVGGRIQGWVDGAPLFDVTDAEPLAGGGIGLICEEGRVGTDAVSISPPR